MHDVAARAGVSHQTVSRVLNDFPGIRPGTRQRVLDAIEELGYRRNLAARTLATGKSQAIGVLAPETPNYGPMATLYATERTAVKAGFHPLITTTSHDPDAVLEGLDFLLGRSIDALLVVAQSPHVTEIVEAMNTGIPVAYVLTGHPAVGSAVAVDQVAGTRLALEHLYALGHRHFQHIAGPEGFTEADMRNETFHAFLKERGLTAYPNLEGDWTPDSGFRAGLQLATEVTALFAANDQMAQGAMHALRGRGLSVPMDVSVVGFDDIPEAAHFYPPLTSVHQDFQGAGEQAVALLLARLEEPSTPAPPPLRPWLVERSSTTRPRG
ncbi:LacI family DNA-binding transcriptional regulator [Demequina sp.]|uniref:LacI family DNA-binding transcriptional regulator n=1 Tax=Demequina sp. TaxID=2050685 RepID=UPI003D09C283